MSLSTEDKVVNIVMDHLGVERIQVTKDAHFANDLGADSLDIVEVIMDLEKEFDIKIPDKDAESISTVGEAISYIEKNS